MVWRLLKPFQASALPTLWVVPLFVLRLVLPTIEELFDYSGFGSISFRPIRPLLTGVKIRPWTLFSRFPLWSRPVATPWHLFWGLLLNSPFYGPSGGRVERGRYFVTQRPSFRYGWLRKLVVLKVLTRLLLAGFLTHRYRNWPLVPPLIQPTRLRTTTALIGAWLVPGKVKTDQPTKTQHERGTSGPP